MTDNAFEKDVSMNRVPQYSATLREGLSVRMSDGVDLVLDLYVPTLDGAPVEGPMPVIVERTPYDRKAERFRDFGSRAAERGFIFVCQDVRGRGDSGGHFHMMTNIPDEGEDGADTMAWVVEQLWCDGRIATVGGSFSAANQQAAALHQPKGLYTQVLRDCGNNYYQRMFRYHGAFNIGVVLPWIVRHGTIGEEAREDPEVAAALAGMDKALGEWALKLPLKRGESPLAQASSYEDIYFKMLETSDDVPYWHNVTIRLSDRWGDYPRDLSVMMISGWFAHHAAANLEKFDVFGRMLEGPVRLIMGPWSHGPQMMEERIDGDVDFGPDALRYDPISKQWLDWIEARLHGEPLKTPRLSYFHMGGGGGHKTEEGHLFHGGSWRDTDIWPVEGMCPETLYLTADGALTDQSPLSASSSSYDFDPSNPTPGIGAVTLPRIGDRRFVRGGPRLQFAAPDMPLFEGQSGALADREDVLVFETAPLKEPLDLTGPVVAKLWVSSSAVDTDFAAQLVDVYPASEDYPEGAPLLITEGIMRMRYRDRQPKAENIEPGKVYPVEIELGPTSNRFEKGHRLRLTISSARFPQYDVNPNTGEPLGQETHRIVAHQTIWHAPDRPSHLLLPVVGS